MELLSARCIEVAAIKPGEASVGIGTFCCRTAEDHVAQFANRSSGVIDIAQETGRHLYTGCAQVTGFLIGLKGSGKVAVGPGDLVRQADSIF